MKQNKLHLNLGDYIQENELKKMELDKIVTKNHKYITYECKNYVYFLEQYVGTELYQVKGWGSLTKQKQRSFKKRFNL